MTDWTRRFTALGQGRSGEVLSASKPQPTALGGQTATITSAADLAAAARQHLLNAEAAAGRGDWGAYGAEMTALRDLLDQVATQGA